MVECLCPPKATGEPRHPDGDSIELRESLPFRSALAARNAIGVLKAEDPDVSTAEILATLTETYILLGIRTWSVVDAKGKPVEVNNVAIREYLFTHQEAAMAVADEADALYRDAVITPLVMAAQRSSPLTPTNGSTSATTGSSPKRPKPPKPSSTSTTRTVGTVTTSPLLAGGSSSSPSSA